MDVEVLTRAQATDAWLSRLPKWKQIDFAMYMLMTWVHKCNIDPRLLIGFIRKFESEKE